MPLVSIAVRPYVALEYLEGRSLRRHMIDGDLLLEEALRIAQAVAAALEEAHRHNVYHRDLKPENIHIGAGGVVKVLDFGLAKMIDDENAPRGGVTAGDDDDTVANTTTVGTPHYMAPEQWQRRRTSGATDVWALGIILWEMLTRTRPFAAPDAEALARQVCDETRFERSDPSVPVGVASLIAIALAKAAADRPSAAEVAQCIAELRAEYGFSDSVPLPSGVGSSVGSAKLATPGSRVPWLLALALVAGGVVWAMQDRPAPSTVRSLPLPSMSPPPPAALPPAGLPPGAFRAPVETARQAPAPRRARRSPAATPTTTSVNPLDRYE